MSLRPPYPRPSGITPARVTPPRCMGLAVLLSVRNGLAHRNIEQTKRVTPPHRHVTIGNQAMVSFAGLEVPRRFSRWGEFSPTGKLENSHECPSMSIVRPPVRQRSMPGGSTATFPRSNKFDGTGAGSRTLVKPNTLKKVVEFLPGTSGRY